MVKSSKPRKSRSSPGASRETSDFSKFSDEEGVSELNLSNHFLIAMPTMLDPVFGGSVVYLCEHNAGGALGVIINKPTDMTIGVLLDRIDLTLEIAPDGVPLDHKPIMFGGAKLPE
jgi:putative transcriptional regulator